ncbi:MAG TPA: glycosyltransferase family 4 protein, partial [Gemmatimonadaceae bacterium]|nr:glycosyltransferase family 4 protein [Gemmatimonadaceae bacterium]
IVASLVFQLGCVFSALVTRNLGGVIVSTSPPFIGLAAVLLRKLRGVRYAYWVMDVNPDQLIALGILAARHPLAKVLARINDLVVRNASLIVVLDRFMAARILERTPGVSRLEIIPPWVRDPAPRAVSREDNEFRVEQGWGTDLVFLYSGNHTPSNPLATLLEAARQLRALKGVRFVFIGGGTGKREVDDMIGRHKLENASSLPYLPLEKLDVSLPAGDVHVISMGEKMTGVIHPSKVYSAMAAGRPILYLGPSASHVTEILDKFDIGWRVDHGDVDGMVAMIRRIAAHAPAELHAIGARGQRALASDFDPATLRERFCRLFEEDVLRATGNRQISSLSS